VRCVARALPKAKCRIQLLRGFPVVRPVLEGRFPGGPAHRFRPTRPGRGVE
jgi:hypothetical protein